MIRSTVDGLCYPIDLLGKILFTPEAPLFDLDVFHKGSGTRFSELPLPVFMMKCMNRLCTRQR